MPGVAILPVEIALWLGIAWYVTERLPALHEARDMTVRGVAMAFTMPLFTTGERGYALRDLVALPAVSSGGLRDGGTGDPALQKIRIE